KATPPQLHTERRHRGLVRRPVAFPIRWCRRPRPARITRSASAPGSAKSSLRVQAGGCLSKLPILRSREMTLSPHGFAPLEAMARREALLGEHQRITHARPFKRANHSLRIKSVRAGFGTNGGWRWELPCDRDGASTASAITREPVRAERPDPDDWVEGVARLPYYRPPTDVPPHRWRQFVTRFQTFLHSSPKPAQPAPAFTF